MRDVGHVGAVWSEEAAHQTLMQRVLRNVAFKKCIWTEHSPLHERIVRPDIVMEKVRSQLVVHGRRHQAADFLSETIGTNNPFVQWAVVRPDTLLEGDVSAYTLHGGLVSSLLAPDRTNMANVAHLMCELVTSPKAWDEWKGKLPVIINAAGSKG